MTDRHAVFMLAYNTTPEQLALTKESVTSILGQDIGDICLHLIDNGSDDDGATSDYFLSVQDAFAGVVVTRIKENQSPLKIANTTLKNLYLAGYKKVLGAANDVVLPSNLYRLMAEWPRGFVAASMTGDRNHPRFETSSGMNECTPMAVLMTRKWAFDALVAKDGHFFDEGYFHYASDCDLALRMCACGIHGVQLDVQYYHAGSSSWRMAKTEVATKINQQADRDRDYFAKKWGFSVGDERYSKAASDINFRGDRL